MWVHKALYVFHSVAEIRRAGAVRSTVPQDGATDQPTIIRVIIFIIYISAVVQVGFTKHYIYNAADGRQPASIVIK